MMSDKKIVRRKIYIACGGSAGHIFPGLALAEELLKRHGDAADITFLTSDNKLGHLLLRGSRFNFHTLPIRGLKKGSMRETLNFASGLIKGSLRSIAIIFSSRPDCFIGFGAYIAGPPFIAASLLRVPTLIHEQNARMGKANKIMRHLATKVALSFPENTKSKAKNVVITGNPIRKSAASIHDKANAIHSLGMDHAKFTILIIGGSQGSHAINSRTIDMFRNMESELRESLQVIHLSGEKDYERLKKEYRDIDISCKLYPFFNDMGIIYSATDASISRAGASVISELCAHKIPSILIPYPFAESHQVQNASLLATKGAAIVIEENRLSKTSLSSAIAKLMNKSDLRKSMSEEIGALANLDAAERLADEVALLTGLERGRPAGG